MTFKYENIINEYVKWIKDNSSIKQIENGNTFGVTTPFLDRHNDHLEIYVLKRNKEFILTDDAHTLGDLQMAGFELNSPKRQKIFKATLNGFGVKISDNNELYIEANSSNLGQKKHYLIQAILAVNDMYSLSKENVYSLFKEDVELYFKSNELVFSKDIKLGGKSGFDHNVDFLIPASNNKLEKLIKALNSPKKDSVTSAIFAFNDIDALREQETGNYVIYNDTSDENIAKDSISALENYGVQAIPWSKRELCLTEFSIK